MKVIRVENKEIKEVNYPNISLENKVAGLVDGIRYYFIIESEKPAFNTEQSYIKQRDILTDESHQDYPHLLICNRVYDVINYPVGTIINRLNDNVGQHIESNFPLWKQNKYISRYIYLGELVKVGQITPEQIAEMQWIGEVDTRAILCRAERDKRESEFINNGIFPDLYNWPEMPQKPL